MKRLLPLLFSAIILLHLSDTALAQSQQAYLKAGDALLQKNDPVAALDYFRQALEYGENADVLLGMAKAGLALFDYESTRVRLLRCLELNGNSSDRGKALLLLAEVQRRLGNFENGRVQLLGYKNENPADSILADSLLRGMESAYQLCRDTLAWQAIPLGGDVNSSYSDFSPSASGDSLLYYSSLRFRQKGTGTESTISRILSASLSEDAQPRSVELPEAINQSSFYNANVSVSPDGKLMAFCRCRYNEENALRCHIYESRWENGRWQPAQKLGDAINKKDFTSTQPHLAPAGIEGYWLLFASDQPGGQGKMDIWMAKRSAKGIYSTAENAGLGINTATDEWTPSLDATTDTLYFSSDRAEGPGGFDLYAASFGNRGQGKARCLPPPYNSGYNDLYLNRSYGPAARRFLVSNRPPAASLQGFACCYDIFELQPAPKKTPELADNRVALAVDTAGNTQKPPPPSFANFDAMSNRDKENFLKQGFPIRLYFDNDQPDPKSRKQTTLSRYDALNQYYMAREAEYLKMQVTDSVRNTLSDFFQDSVSGNLNRLEELSSQLALVLVKPGCQVTLKMEGTASPLANRGYNLTLSARRTASVINYWREWGKGEIDRALQEGRLKVEFVFSGEVKSAATVSDRIEEPGRSIYSPDAALERRIEITDIRIQP